MGDFWYRRNHQRRVVDMERRHRQCHQQRWHREYVRAAELLSSGDWQAALTVYKWPFYPWLMMWVGDTVGISYETAGHALNTLFFTLGRGVSSSALCGRLAVARVRSHGLPCSLRWLTLCSMNTVRF